MMIFFNGFESIPGRTGYCYHLLEHRLLCLHHQGRWAQGNHYIMDSVLAHLTQHHRIPQLIYKNQILISYSWGCWECQGRKM